MNALAHIKPALDAGSQGEFIEKGGWAKLPGNNSAQRVTSIAKACAALLACTA